MHEEDNFITPEDSYNLIKPNEQPPCGKCDFKKYFLKGCDTGQYICIHCGFRISEEEYKLWKAGKL